jgi:dTDP-4-dehydrorhamnose reductase
LRIVADQTGNPTYAPHLASAVLDVARAISHGSTEDRHWGTYHAAGSGETTWYGFAGAILTVGGTASASLEAITSDEYPAKAPRPRNSALACGKFADAFGLSLPPWQEGVAQCVQRLAAA